MHGIGAAKRWIHDELQSYSPRLEVSYQDFSVKKGARQGQIIRDVDLSNIVAVLPGGIHKDRYVLVSAHYDSVALIRKPYTGEEQAIAEAVRQGYRRNEARKLRKVRPPDEDLGPLDMEATATQPIAPGVTDDGSGTAAVMELARVMSQYQFDKTIVFIAFAAEEIGLSGSQTYAAMAKQTGMQIEAVLNNDIIGSDVAGNGRSASSVLRLFAAGPEDSPSRELGRYMKQIAQRFVPSMQVEMVFRRRPFYARRRPHAIPEPRLSGRAADDRQRELQEPALDHRYLCEHLGSLHHAGRPNERGGSGEPGACSGSAGAELDLFVGTEQRRSHTAADQRQVGIRRGSALAPEQRAGSRGLCRDDAVDYIAGVGTRDLGRQRDQLTMPDVSIDDVVIGVKAVDRDGNQSVVSPYMEPVLPAMLTPATSQIKGLPTNYYSLYCIDLCHSTAHTRPSLG